jgi:hypothetical protein
MNNSIHRAETWIMPTPPRTTGRLPETDVLLLSVRQFATLAEQFRAPAAPQTITEQCAARLWQAVAEYSLAHPRQLPLPAARATMTLYRTLKRDDERAQLTALATLVDVLVAGPRWIACSQGVDDALGQAERFLRFTLTDATEVAQP